MVPCLLGDQSPLPTYIYTPTNGLLTFAAFGGDGGRLWWLPGWLQRLELNKFLKNRSKAAMRTGKCTVKRQLIRSLVVTLLNMSHVNVQTVLWESNGYVVKKPSDWSSSVICLIYSTICHVLCIRAYICHSYCTLQTSVYFQCGRNCSPLESPAEEQ